jgi:hypothetical protein
MSMSGDSSEQLPDTTKSDQNEDREAHANIEPDDGYLSVVVIVARSRRGRNVDVR